jgi:hypothetical protein
MAKFRLLNEDLPSLALKQLEGELGMNDGLGFSGSYSKREADSAMKSLKDEQLVLRNFEGFETPKSDRKGALGGLNGNGNGCGEFPSITNRQDGRRDSMTEAIIENQNVEGMESISEGKIIKAQNE